MLYEQDIQLLTLDIENIYTDYGGIEVRADAAEHLEELLICVDGLQIALLTNNTGVGFGETVMGQLPDHPHFYQPSLTMPKKPHPLMFTTAQQQAGVAATNAAHVDDQLKNLWGAHRAGYAAMFWPLPHGEHQHKWVRRARPFENLVRNVVSTQQNVKELVRGDW